VCPIGAAFVSAAAGCKPSTTAWAAPSDTAFALSGTQAEGLVAFAGVTAPLGVTYASSVFNAGPYNGALTLAAGSYVTAPGAGAPPSMPAGNSPWTASAWVKCAAPTTYAAVLEWGAPGDAKGVLTQSSIVLAVGGAYNWNVAALANKGVATTLAGSAAGYADGIGTSAGLRNIIDMDMDQSTGSLVVVQGGSSPWVNVIRRVSLDGTVTTVAGNPAVDCYNVPAWNHSSDPQPPNRPQYIDGVGTNACFARAQSVMTTPDGTIYVGSFAAIHTINPVTLQANVWMGCPGSHNLGGLNNGGNNDCCPKSGLGNNDGVGTNG